MFLSINDIPIALDDPTDFEGMTDEALGWHFVINGFLTAFSYLKLLSKFDPIGYSTLSCELIEVIGGLLVTRYGVSKLIRSKNSTGAVMSIDGLASVALCTYSSVTSPALPTQSNHIINALGAATPYIAFAAAAQAWMVFGYTVVKWQSAVKKCDPKELLKDRIKKYHELEVPCKQKEKYLTQITALALTQGLEAVGDLLKQANIVIAWETPSSSQQALVKLLLTKEEEKANIYFKEAITAFSAAIGLTILAIGTVTSIGTAPVIVAGILLLIAAMMKSYHMTDHWLNKKAREQQLPKEREKFINTYDKEKLAVINKYPNFTPEIKLTSEIKLTPEIKVQARIVYEKKRNDLFKKYQDDIKKQEPGIINSEVEKKFNESEAKIEAEFYALLFKLDKVEYLRILKQAESIIDKTIYRNILNIGRKCKLSDSEQAALSEKEQEKLTTKHFRKNYCFFSPSVQKEQPPATISSTAAFVK